MMQPRWLARASASLALLALSFALCAAAPAPKKSSPAAKPAAPAKPPAAPDPITKNPKFKGWVNGVPDTGQFLADSVWILRVGPRVSTVGDFVESWFASYPEHRPPMDSTGRVTFLNSMMHKDVLALAAKEIKKPLGFEDRLQITQARQRALASATHRRFVQDSLHVTEEEVRALYDTHKWEQHFRHILFADRNAAENARRELISGRITWSAAFKKYSPKNLLAIPGEGDVGFVPREKLDREFANVVFALKPGETSIPVQDHAGWHLVQSLERRPKPAPLYENLRPMLVADAEASQSVRYMEQILGHLRAKVGMRYDTANARFAAGHFVNTRSVTKTSFGPSIDIDAAVPEFTSQDTAKLLARWNNGGRFSIGDLVHEYHEIPPLVRPTLNVAEVLLDFVESVVLEPGIAEYGAERGLEKDPLVEKAIAKKTEEIQVEHLYQDSVASRVWVSKEERQAYYQKNLNAFHTYPSVDFAAFVRHNKPSADSLEKALRAGTDPRAILRADSLAGREASGTIQHRTQNEHGPYQGALFEEMRPGDIQVRGPDRHGDYAIIKLIAFDGGRQLSYEESQLMIDESLQNMKTDEALQALVGRLQKRYNVASRPQLMMLIKLSDPTIKD